jgi:hypothetical protein
MSEEEMVSITYDVLKLLDDYGSEMKPKYTEITGPNKGELFELTDDYLKYLLEENININDDGSQALDLGRHLAFLSTFEERKACSINIHVGVSYKEFTNTLSITLPDESFSGFNERKNDFEILMKNLISVFKPFWGCVENSKTSEEYNYRFWNIDKPVSVHWLNYFDKETAKAIGEDKLLQLEGVEKFGDGYLCKLCDEPFDVCNPDHVAKQKEINNYLGLGIPEISESEKKRRLRNDLIRSKLRKKSKRNE